MSKFSHRDHFFKCQEKQRLKREIIINDMTRSYDHAFQILKIELDKLRIKSDEDFLLFKISEFVKNNNYIVTEEELKNEVKKIKSDIK